MTHPPAVRAKCKQTDGQGERQMLEHTSNWQISKGTVGRHELKVPMSRKMQWPVQDRGHMSHTRCSARSRIVLPPECCNSNNLPRETSNWELKLISWGTKLTQWRLPIDGAMATQSCTMLPTRVGSASCGKPPFWDPVKRSSMLLQGAVSVFSTRGS